MTNSSKTAAVTGASSGMGRDIARAFLEGGWNVVLNGRDAGKLERVATDFGKPRRIATVAGDIGDKATGERIARIAEERFDGIDVLINNAGTFSAKPFLDVTEDDLDHYLDGNLKGTYFTTQAVVARMKARHRKGSIVNIGTVLIDHSLASVPASAALVSKGGVHALTTSLAAELASDGIRVNAVAPGVVRTPIHGDADVDSFGGVALLNRVGEVQDTTQAVLYLAQAEFVTGHILNVDGGFVAGRS